MISFTGNRFLNGGSILAPQSQSGWLDLEGYRGRCISQIQFDGRNTMGLFFPPRLRIIAKRHRMDWDHGGGFDHGGDHGDHDGHSGWHGGGHHGDQWRNNCSGQQRLIGTVNLGGWDRGRDWRRGGHRGNWNGETQNLAVNMCGVTDLQLQVRNDNAIINSINVYSTDDPRRREMSRNIPISLIGEDAHFAQGERSPWLDIDQGGRMGECVSYITVSGQDPDGNFDRSHPSVDVWACQDDNHWRDHHGHDRGDWNGHGRWDRGGDDHERGGGGRGGDDHGRGRGDDNRGGDNHGGRGGNNQCRVGEPGCRGDDHGHNH